MNPNEPENPPGVIVGPDNRPFPRLYQPPPEPQADEGMRCGLSEDGRFIRLEWDEPRSDITLPIGEALNFTHLILGLALDGMDKLRAAMMQGRTMPPEPPRAA